MMKPILAVSQLTSTDNAEQNFTLCHALVKEACARGVSLLSFPENFAFLSDKSSPLGDDWLKRYCDLAKQYDIWLSLGGFLERDSEHIYNTHLVVNDKGEITARYHKIHLFSMGKLDESKTITAGNNIISTSSPVGELGLSVCYDLRFPELYTSLMRMGAQVLLVPAAFTTTTGKAHWEVLLRARAIENQCYVAAAAQVGVHYPSRKTHGHAMIVDPWGCVVAQCGESMGIACVEIDLEYLAQVRVRIPMSHTSSVASRQQPSFSDNVSNG